MKEPRRRATDMEHWHFMVLGLIWGGIFGAEMERIFGVKK